MKTKIFTLITLSFVIISLFTLGCTNSLTDDEIKSKMILANSNIDSYKSDSKIDMIMDAYINDMHMSAIYEMTSLNEIDKKNKMIKTEGVMNVKVLGQEQNVDIKSYMVDGYIYTKTTDKWTKVKYDKESIFNQQDQFTSITSIIQNSSIEKLKSEDKTYIVLKIIPNIDEFIDKTMQDSNQVVFIEENVTVKDILKDYSVTLWIDKNSFLIDRYKVEVEIGMKGKEMGKEYDGMNATGHIKMITDTKISSINSELSIVLPSDAVDAEEIAPASS